MLETIQITADYLASQSNIKPVIGIILGTGLGGLVQEIEIEKSIPYEDIPNFPVSTVEGHSGRLIFGTINNVPILAMQGRFHYYEGYNMQEVTFPVRVMKQMGINTLFVSNASGGLNPDYVVGDIMVINDHINMFGDNPLIGKNNNKLGPRFPDMSEPYSKQFIAEALEIGKENGIDLKEGVYVGTTGPTFETPAEYKMFRILGADAVGMSTVPEVIVARHMDMKCFGISIITDSGVPGQIVEVSHEEVQEVAAAAEPKMTKVIKELVSRV
ncbi:purine-nucleoside phosphorylase [Carboxylicivirga mesophila]|uniref:Purine nucleoside phosphorylase n=1 Tax=Carboxylicivirga mesophila TaxID=1166478 RepID=A0ABS5K631_9BACT|nr:purine-nucleoside phosphorylase [Carboxylicivirga mesophila]MBS2209971.1 purine-nucleoside phosphorylase [Carboxylicivirga mesophila]